MHVHPHGLAEADLELVQVEWFDVAAAGWEHLPEGGQQTGFFPRFEIREEIADGGVGCASRCETRGSGLVHQVVDQGRNAIECFGPVLVAAAEDCIGDALERRDIAAFKPGHKLLRIVRGLPIVGGGYDYHWLISRQVDDGTVKRGELLVGKAPGHHCRC